MPSRRRGRGVAAPFGEEGERATREGTISRQEKALLGEGTITLARQEGCDYIGKGGEITRVKMHLAGGYPDVAKCKKVPTEIRKLFQNNFQQAKEETLKKKALVEEECCRTMHEQVYDQYESHGDDVDPDLTVGIRASLEHQYMTDEGMRHRRPDSQWEHGGGSGVQRSASMRQPTTPSRLGRTSSMRHGGLRGFMRGLGRRSAPDIVDIDPQAYPPQTAKQTRIDDAYTKEKK
ncbi:hypothetical protein BHM03_00027106 [Ensete ventricosum]|nr:hypothetical protein BHM03_00027106 [Ensete ventricosum]